MNVRLKKTRFNLRRLSYNEPVYLEIGVLLQSEHKREFETMSVVVAKPVSALGKPIRPVPGAKSRRKKR